MKCDACGDKPKNESKHFPKAVIEINNPESLILFRKVVIPASMGDDTEFPPIIGKYYNVLLHYDANGRNYIYSSDGIPTAIEAAIPPELYKRIENLETDLGQEEIDRANADNLLDGKITTLGGEITIVDGKITTLDNSLASVAKSGSYNDLTNKPTIGNGTLTIQKNGTSVGTFKANATSNTSVNITVPDADQSLNLTSTNSVANSAVSTAINETVMTDISLNANTSTTTVQIDGAKKNLYSGVTSTKNVALPVASTTQAGVMNSSTYDAVTANTTNINAIMNGAVAITGLSASPSQSDLTTAWQTETGLTTLINRASIYDVSNNKVWTYYTNDTTWHAASNTSQVTVNTFTNNSEGVIKGSTNVGQIFAENDGTGSVNGWDTLSNAVSTNTSDIASLQGAIPTVNNATLTIQNNGTNVATFTANSATNTTANIVPPVQIGSVLSTPSSVEYVDTANIVDEAVTANKFAEYAVNNAIETNANLSPASDTPSGWDTLLGGNGYFITYYRQSGTFANQPATYGLLETINHGGRIEQRWVGSDGILLYRSGTADGWYGSSSAAGTFRQVVDTHVETSTFSMESGYTAGGISFIKKNGNLVTWQLQFTSTSAMSADTSYTVCTIPSGFRPPQTTMGFGSTTTGAHYITCFVNTDGTVSARPSANIATTTSRYICGSYLID